MLNNRTTSKIRYEDVEIKKTFIFPDYSDEQIEAALKKNIK
jgi:hypothetical protein